jgi:hypothetical protein
VKIATVTALVLLVVTAASAAAHKRLWKAVPGHKNILLDLASIEPMRTLSIPARPYHFGIPPTDTTSLAIKLNGHLFGGYMIDCSGPGMRAGTATVYMPQKLNEPPTRVMGYVPEGVVQAIACPIAREMRRRNSN